MLKYHTIDLGINVQGSSLKKRNVKQPEIIVIFKILYLARNRSNNFI